jgi:hypothetical protein
MMQYNESDQLSNRPLRAHIDRHAVSLAGHLLMAGVWLERRLMSVPRNGFPWIETPGRRAPSTLVVRTYERQVDSTRDEKS